MPPLAPTLLLAGLLIFPLGQGSPTADPGEEARRQVRALIVEEQPRRALALLEPWIAREPEEPGFQALLGEVHYALENHEAAIEAFARAVELSPDYRGKLFHYGRALQALDRHEEALAIFEAMVRSDQLTLRVRGEFGRGLSRQALGDDGSARTAFEAALALDPTFTRATYRIALLDIAAGEDARAQPLLRAVLDDDPLHHGAAYNLALVFERLGQESEAAWERYRAILEGKQRISALRDRLTGGRGDFRILVELGDLHAELAMPRRAAQWYGRAAQLDPFDPRPAVGTVAALRALGRPEDAERLCIGLLTRPRPIEELRAPLIELLEARGATDEAKRWRESAPRRAPSPPNSEG